MFDPALLVQYLIGTWNCSFQMESRRASYTAVYSRGFAKPWLQQTDTWAGGGGDRGFYAFDSHTQRWTAIYMEENGQTTIFISNPAADSRILYRSVYPDTTAHETFAREGPARYTLAYEQTSGGKTIASKDVCTRAAPAH